MHSCFLTSLTSAVLMISGWVTDQGQARHDVLVAKDGEAVTLPCSHSSLKETMVINWQWRPHDKDSMSLILTANQQQEFLGGASKRDARLADSNFWHSGNFSLIFRPGAEDGGFYSCLANQGQQPVKVKVTLLVILTVLVSPSVPVPEQGTLRLQAEVSSPAAVAEVSWLSPHGMPLRCETLPSGAVVTKLPLVTRADGGSYICKVMPQQSQRKSAFLFSYPVMVAAGSREDRIKNITSSPMISKACLSQMPVSLPCSRVSGDYVLLYWQHADNQRKIEFIFSYDRWRQHVRNQSRSFLELASAESARSGHFAFQLSPRLKEGGVYMCEVFLDDSVFRQSSTLSVLHVAVETGPSSLTLNCLYSERSHVRQVAWAHQNLSRILNWYTTRPGSLMTEVQLPATAETAGNYTCTLELRNRMKIEAVYVVMLPPAELPMSPPSSPFSSLSFLSILGVLLPMVAVATGVLLWKLRARNARPAIEQSLSHYSGEVENIYENPEDLRQQTQSSVYMDLKPTSEDDVYKELDRYEHCPY